MRWPGRSRRGLRSRKHQGRSRLSIATVATVGSFTPHSDTLIKEYKYQPIKSPDQLRMLELLHGQDDETVQIKLSHRPLSDLPLCEALSYEWGCPTRDFEIRCEGKSMKVTSNLLAALKRLRPQTSGTRLLWIDALCINQEDIDERSAQVKLMTEIYRNARRTLVWIGEAPPEHAHEAFEIIKELGKIIEDLGIRDLRSTSPGDSLLKTIEIRSRYTLEQLVTDDVWHSIIDVLTGRAYFTRLWTLQEICLSCIDKIIVYCGSYSLSWTIFYHAALFLEQCANDLPHGWNAEGLFNVILPGELHTPIIRGSNSLHNCISAAYHRVATEPRDRIFGLLGMLDAATHLELRYLSYSTSLGRIFQALTKCLIREQGSLYYLQYHTFVFESVIEAHIPSWVLWMDNNPLEQVDLPFVNIDFTGIKERLVILSGSVMYTLGFIFDIVTLSCDNLSAKNLGSQVLVIYDNLTESSEVFKDTHSVIKMLWQNLTIRKEAHEGKHYVCFLAWLVDLQTIRLAVTARSSLPTPSLNGLPNDNTLIPGRFASELSAKFGMNSTCDEEREIVAMAKQASSGGTPIFENDVINECEDRVFDSKRSQGRNLFISRRGYCGAGPAGVNITERISPTVQVGDCISYISTAGGFVILRRIDERHFRLVGLAHIPLMVDDPDFRKAMAAPRDFQKFRII